MAETNILDVAFYWRSDMRAAIHHYCVLLAQSLVFHRILANYYESTAVLPLNNEQFTKFFGIYCEDIYIFNDVQLGVEFVRLCVETLVVNATKSAFLFFMNEIEETYMTRYVQSILAGLFPVSLEYIGVIHAAVVYLSKYRRKSLPVSVLLAIQQPCEQLLREEELVVLKRSVGSITNVRILLSCVFGVRHDLQCRDLDTCITSCWLQLLLHALELRIETG
jgi:hypothetical protein